MIFLHVVIIKTDETVLVGKKGKLSLWNSAASIEDAPKDTCLHCVRSRKTAKTPWTNTGRYFLSGLHIVPVRTPLAPKHVCHRPSSTIKRDPGRNGSQTSMFRLLWKGHSNETCLLALSWLQLWDQEEDPTGNGFVGRGLFRYAASTAR